MRKREEVFVLLNSSFLKKRWNELYSFQLIVQEKSWPINNGGEKNVHCSLHWLGK